MSILVEFYFKINKNIILKFISKIILKKVYFKADEMHSVDHSLRHYFGLTTILGDGSQSPCHLGA